MKVKYSRDTFESYHDYILRIEPFCPGTCGKCSGFKECDITKIV